MTYPIDNGNLTWTFAEIDKPPEESPFGPLVTVLGCEDTPSRWAELVNVMGEEIVLNDVQQIDELIEALQRVREWIAETGE